MSVLDDKFLSCDPGPGWQPSSDQFIAMTHSIAANAYGICARRDWKRPREGTITPRLEPLHVGRVPTHDAH